MPPEAIQGSAPVGPRSDLYSLGALGYYLLTGHYIFDADKIADVYDKQLTTAPIPPSQRTTQPISADMEKLLLRCLEKDMNARPSSASALQTQLLALPTAAEWMVAARLAWWDAYEKQTATTGNQMPSTSSTPLPTVSIDLAGRME